MQRIQKCLKKGGTLFLQTPCSGIVSDTFGKLWGDYVYPAHLHIFSQDSLFRLLVSNGFNIVNWVRFGSGNPKGSIPDDRKKVIDSIAKQLGIGDQIALWAILS
jgi:hypothetical protein